MKKPIPLKHQHLANKAKNAEVGFVDSSKIKKPIHFIGQERALTALYFGVGIKKSGYNIFAMGPIGIGKRLLVTQFLEEHAKQLPIPPDWCYVYNFAAPNKPIAIKFPAGTGIVFQRDMEKFVEDVGTLILAIFESEIYQNKIARINKLYDGKNKKAPLKNKLISSSKERHEKEKNLQIKLVRAGIHTLLEKLQLKYKKYPTVIAYLSGVSLDILKHITQFISKENETDFLTLNLENPALTKYKVNLLVDNSGLKSAPIIYEQTPNYAGLISRVEHTSHHGNLVTNFSLIRAGALHKANGGYLIIEARKFNVKQDAWEALKSALYAKAVNIEPIKHISPDSISPVTLEPMAIPLNIKIVLLGERSKYYNMGEEDPDFFDLFRVPVDFNDEINRSKKNILLYAKNIAAIVNREGLRAFLSSAIVEIINYSSRLAEDNQKLSTYIRVIEALLVEADYWAGVDNKKRVDGGAVKKAIHAQLRRMDRSMDQYYEDIHRNFIIIETSGKSIGQVNCLSVRKVGNFSYGHPTRVTARVRAGKGKFIDIQREVKLAGPLHTKGGLIIANFLGSFFQNAYSLFASLAFEQIYCWTEGDSASLGELCALLSALAEVPVIQSMAVTGSVDQYGLVQAVGGINEKIEGFFDVCQQKGLHGQAVLLPAVNHKNLMLKDEVISAVKAKKFFIYPIEHVNQAVYLLTGMIPGERNKQGQFPKDSLYFKVEQRLLRFTKKNIP